MASITVFLVVLCFGGAASTRCVLSGSELQEDVAIRSQFIHIREECISEFLSTGGEERRCADSNGNGLQQPQETKEGKQFTFEGFVMEAKKSLGKFDVIVHQERDDEGILCYSHQIDGQRLVSTACDKPLDGLYIQIHPREGDILEDVCSFIVFGAPQCPADTTYRKGGTCIVAEANETEGSYPLVAQSSTAYGGSAEYAIDGRLDTNYFSYSCTHTDETYRPWWYADLGGVRTVTLVRILNRGDCCSGRLTNFDIAVVNTPPDQSCTEAGDEGCRDYAAENALCHSQGRQYVSGEWKTFPCANPVTGRYLVVQLKGSNYLTLCEVHATCSDVSGNCIAGSSEGRCPHGYKADGTCRGDEPDCENVAQISTAYRGFAANAIDGKPNTSYSERSCTHTDNIYRPWWYVSLGGLQTVTSVRILNRGDCCADRLTNFDIAVVNTLPDQSCTEDGDESCRDYAAEGSLCHSQGSEYVTGEWKTFQCANPVTGRYLVVQLKDRNYLTLCEVEATCSGVDGNCIPGC